MHTMHRRRRPPPRCATPAAAFATRRSMVRSRMTGSEADPPKCMDVGSWSPIGHRTLDLRTHPLGVQMLLAVWVPSGLR